MDVSVKALLSTPLFICFMHFILFVVAKKKKKKSAFKNVTLISADLEKFRPKCCPLDKGV